MICKLPELMQAKGVKDQKTLAAETGLSATTIGKLYRSEFSRIDEKTILTLYRFFGCKTISELIEVEGDE